MALVGQSILAPGGRSSTSVDLAAAVRWYVLGTGVLLIGWAGTRPNLRLMRESRGGPALHRQLEDRSFRRRAVTTGAAFVLVVAGMVLLWFDWYSFWGGALWVTGLVTLVAAWITAAAETRVTSLGQEVSEPSPWTLPRRTELAALTVILTVAAVMRIWRTDDLSSGMHGDEGEAGLSALQILHGTPVSPFTRGWMNHSNIYFWIVAFFIRLLGANLVGLRALAVVSGMVTVLFVYLLARELFGIRAAILAGCFVAFGSADVYFSHQLSSNSPFPALLAGALYFLVKGLRTRRHLDFVLAGLLASFELYFYAGGRLVPIMLVAYLGYLTCLNRRFPREYGTQLLAFAAALVAMAAPFATYYAGHPLNVTDYPNDRFIWLHHAELAGTYGAADWGAIVWGQLVHTVGVINFYTDVSAISVLTFPLARPLEAVLIVLGAAWALSRWRDARFALLNLVFWMSIILGGVLTLDAPNVPRIMGILVVMPIFIAAVLDNFAGLLAEAARRVAPPAAAGRLGGWLGAAALGAAVVVSGGDNWNMYVNHYLNDDPNVVATGQAAFVQHTGYAYHYYDLGMPTVYWGHGDNHFINYAADGEDVVNPSDFLPIVDNGAQSDRPAAFLIWSSMSAYLGALRTYYPGGRTERIPVGNAVFVNNPLVAYLVPRAAIDSHRTVRVAYRRSDGVRVTSSVAILGWGPGQARPARLRYPSTVSWSGGLVVPREGLYRFSFPPSGAQLSLDGVPVPRSASGIRLARGTHAVRFTVRLAGASTSAYLDWSDAATPLAPVQRRYLWDQHVPGAWTGTIRPDGATLPQVTLHRIDGLLAFRDTAGAFGLAGPFHATWNTILTVPAAGIYRFQLNAAGSAALRIGRHPVVADSAAAVQASPAQGSVFLTPGRYPARVDYAHTAGLGFLELAWQPPGGSMTPMLGPSLAAPPSHR